MTWRRLASEGGEGAAAGGVGGVWAAAVAAVDGGAIENPVAALAQLDGRINMSKNYSGWLMPRPQQLSIAYHEHPP